MSVDEGLAEVFELGYNSSKMSLVYFNNGFDWKDVLRALSLKVESVW